MDEAAEKEKMAQEACRLKVDCLYSFKSHFVSEQLWSRFDLITGAFIAILAAIAGGLALYPDKDYSAYAGVVALVASVLTSMVTVMKTDEKSRLHHAAGCKLNTLMTKIRHFQELDCPVRPISELREKLEDFLQQKDEINQSSPGFSSFSYWLAKRGIKKGQAKYPECVEEFKNIGRDGLPQPSRPNEPDSGGEDGKIRESKAK